MSRKALSEAKSILAIELVLLIGLGLFTKIGGGIVLLLILFTFYFFRDPTPLVAADPNAIVAPATGKVDLIDTTDEPLFRGSASKRVSIFLSVFDVHTQRAPIDCTVKLIKYVPGKFANAINPSCATVNEHQILGLEGEGIRVTVRQIAGLIARRICTWTKEGDVLPKGAHLGMIRFGSRVDIYLPLETEIVTKLGDHVKGGETILARRK
jgi:phosphatidylserine decarboxylase